jgi:hypothetical protein
MHGVALRLSVCVGVKCYKVGLRSGYQAGRLSASSNWIYPTGPRRQDAAASENDSAQFSRYRRVPKGTNLPIFCASALSFFLFISFPLSLSYKFVWILPALAADLSKASKRTAHCEGKETGVDLEGAVSCQDIYRNWYKSFLLSVLRYFTDNDGS